MIVELGNNSPKAHANGLDDRPKVTTIHVPEFDDGSNAEDGVPRGGYTHQPGLTPQQFKDELYEAVVNRDGIFRLPDHEALLAIHNAWNAESNEPPTWCQVTPSTPQDGVLRHDDASCADIENFLHEHLRTGGERKPANVEDTHWTRAGAPGVAHELTLPDAEALYTNAGRVISNVNDGGGQVGATGTGTAATATTLTTNLTLTTNAWAGYRVYVMQTATGPLVWGNVLSNTNAAGASVLTVDRWYSAATPGGSAATTPSAGFYFMLADGGMTSTWFVGMTTTNITPAATDTALTGEYTIAAGGMFRKIAPYAQTSGVASRSITLTPVFTANGSDTFPSTFFAIGVGASMVQPFPAVCMKFETSLNASATINASGDQITVTETITGS